MPVKSSGFGEGSSELAEQEGCNMSSSLIIFQLEIFAHLSVSED